MAAVSIRNSTLFKDVNLVAYWEMEGNSNDSIGSNNGTDTAITYNTGNGKFLQGAGGNGTTSKIVLADSSSLKPAGNFTILAWVKLNSLSDNSMIFQSYSQNTNVAGIQLQVNLTGGRIGATSGKNTGTSAGTDYQTVTGSTDIVTGGTLHLVAVVYNGSNLLLYVDGVQDGTAVWTNSPVYAGTNYPRIGVGNNTGADSYWFFNGAIDDLALFSKALSPTEISNHFSGADSILGGVMNLTSKMW